VSLWHLLAAYLCFYRMIPCTMQSMYEIYRSVYLPLHSSFALWYHVKSAKYIIKLFQWLSTILASIILSVVFIWSSLVLDCVMCVFSASHYTSEEELCSHQYRCHLCCLMPLVIETLLCYLELHSKKWIENLQPIFANCTLQFYGGRAQMLAVAKKVNYSSCYDYSFVAVDFLVNFIYQRQSWNHLAMEQSLAVSMPAIAESVRL